MLRTAFIVCALIASAVCAARPMVIHQAQTLEPPAGSGYYFFGYEVAIDGDWAIVMAATPSPTPTSPQQTHDALLYHRVNGQWTLDRILMRRVSTEYGQYVGFRAVAMSNGLAAIGANPTRIFRRTGDTWTEIAHPFTAPGEHPDFVNGELVWDGNTLLAAQHQCVSYQQRPWGALISRLNADGSWTPIERLSSGDLQCVQEPGHWGISGDTAVAGTWSFDYEVAPDQLHIFRRFGTTWMPTSAIDGGHGEGAVRGNEIFFSSDRPGGTLVYRNDDSRTVIDNIRTVSASYRDAFGGFGFAHTADLFVQDRDVFRKNSLGRHEHVATLVPTGSYGMVDDAKLNRRRLISQAFRDRISSNQAVLIFDLPTTYTPSPVRATGFESGPPPFTPQLGSFAVASANGNHVFRQSNLAGEHRALLGDSDWVEQSIEADIEPTAFSGADRWAGLAVRYQDDANYYYVTLRSSGMVQLKRMRNGSYTTLSQRALPIVAGRSYRVGLQAFGTLIMVRIDGREFIWSSDAQAIPRGSAALLGYRAAVDYDNVVAAQVGQSPIFDLALAGCHGPLSSSPVWASNGTGTWYCSASTGENVMQQTSTSGIARALVGTPTDDQILTTRARLVSANGRDRWLAVAARYVDESNYYYLTLRTSNSVSLRKLVNGAVTVLGTARLPVKAGTWYALRLDAVGDELRAFVNGVQVLEVTDPSHPRGQGGILTNRAAAEFADYFSWQP